MHFSLYINIYKYIYKHILHRYNINTNKYIYICICIVYIYICICIVCIYRYRTWIHGPSYSWSGLWWTWPPNWTTRSHFSDENGRMGLWGFQHVKTWLSFSFFPMEQLWNVHHLQKSIGKVFCWDPRFAHPRKMRKTNLFFSWQEAGLQSTKGLVGSWAAMGMFFRTCDWSELFLKSHGFFRGITLW
jgi:hypothetical protein